MKLWIDDIRTPPDDTWHIARNVSSAIRALDMFGPDITEISLDHDISHQLIMGKMSRPYACEETFEAVARYIALLKTYIETPEQSQTERTPKWNPKIQIHTSNYVGAQNMKKILDDVGLNPNVVIAPGANRLETIL